MDLATARQRIAATRRAGGPVEVRARVMTPAPVVSVLDRIGAPVGLVHAHDERRRF